MGIVVYYLDVDAAQLAVLKAKPALVWNIQSDPRFAKASMVDADKDAEILSWLVSPTKRIEKCHEAAWGKVNDQYPDASREEFKTLVAKSVAELGCAPKSAEVDPLLSALEGRGAGKEKNAVNFGLATSVFPPERVKLLAVSFAKFDTATLSQRFNRADMAKFDVGGVDWETESDDVLTEFLVPSFEKISSFYQRAAKLNHYVLVIYQ